MKSNASSHHGPKGSSKGRILLGQSVVRGFEGHAVGDRPKLHLPAIAVLGRSNVGKSSLLNALLKTQIARVSQTPGRTQALFWYRVDGRFDVVDCPGYGYAKTAKDKRAHFSEQIDDVLSGERPVNCVLLLVDGRLDPQESDRSMALYLEELGMPTIVAATKWDDVKPSQRVKQLRSLTGEYARSIRTLQPVSSETGENLETLGRAVLALIKEASTGSPAQETVPHLDPQEEE